jgi:hypothetical protein
MTLEWDCNNERVDLKTGCSDICAQISTSSEVVQSQLAKVLLKAVLVKQQKAHSQIAYSLCGKYNETQERMFLHHSRPHSLLNSDVVLPFHTILYITRSILCRYTLAAQHSHKSASNNIYAGSETRFYSRHIPLHPTTQSDCVRQKKVKVLEIWYTPPEFAKGNKVSVRGGGLLLI